MSPREKTSIRLDPDVITLGRKLAKKDFGSEDKFGLLIENAIRSYHARQVQPVEASSLLSATEEALIGRIEKRIDEMGKKTIERIGNLTAKSSYDTALTSLMIEQIYIGARGNPKKAKEEINSLKGEAVSRMKNRLDKESAEQISSLLQENANLEKQYNELRETYIEAQKRFKEKEELLQDQMKANDEKSNNTIRAYQRKIKELGQWIGGLKTYIAEKDNVLGKGRKLFDEYISSNPLP